MIQTEHEVLEINNNQKSLLVKNLNTGDIFKDYYDKLVLATGAAPFVPNVEGIQQPQVFFLRNVQNAVAIKSFLIKNKPRTAVSVDRAINIPHANLREKLEELDRNKVTVTYCNKGVTGNAAQNVLLNHGFKNVYNLSGGHKFYVGSKENKKAADSAERE